MSSTWFPRTVRPLFFDSPRRASGKVSVLLALTLLIVASVSSVPSNVVAARGATGASDHATGSATNSSFSTGPAVPLSGSIPAALVSSCQSVADKVGCLTIRSEAAGASPSAHWTNLTSAPEPPTFLSSSIVYDAADGYVLLFGGLLGNQSTNQTWKFQNAVWTNLTATVGPAPSPRYDMAMTYDASDRYVLAFGGESNPAFNRCAPQFNFPGCTHADTWAYRSGTWTHLPTTCAVTNGVANRTIPCYNDPWGGPLLGGPAPMTYDAHDGYVLMTNYFTGNSSIVPTWAYHNLTWTRINSSAIVNSTFDMPVDGLGSLAYDAADGYVVAFGSGEGNWPYWNGYLPTPSSDRQPNNYTYAYSNYAWTNLSAHVGRAPPPRVGPALAYDSQDGYLLLYGGWNGTRVPCIIWPSAGGCPNGTLWALKDTWAYAHGSWTNLSRTLPGPAAPEPAADARLVDDLGDSTFLLAGGWGCALFGCINPGGGWFCGSPYGYWDLCPGGGTARDGMWAWDATPPLFGAKITESRTTATAGVAVKMSVSFGGGTAPIAFAWRFGDGSSASAETVSHSYNRSGAYGITVWVNDSAGYSQNSSTSIWVNPTLSNLAGATPNPTDAGLPVDFVPGITNGTPPYTYSWSFGDGKSSTDAVTSHTYRTNGTYLANLSVNDSGGAGTTAGLVILVHPPLNVSLNITPLPADLGQLVNFSARLSGGTPPVVLTWAFGDGGTGGNLSNISHIYTTNGPFWPAVTATDAAGQVVTADSKLIIALNVSILSNGTLGAAPLPVGFASRVTGGEPGYRYAWNFGDGGTSPLADPSHMYVGPGQYNATLQVTDAAGAVAIGRISTIRVAPGGGSLYLQLLLASPTVVLGQSETITANPSGGFGLYELLWTSVPAGCSASPPLAIDCRPAVSGIYRVTALLSDVRGATTEATATFSVGGGSPIGTQPSSSFPSLPAGLGTIAPLAVGFLALTAAASYVLGTRLKATESGPVPETRYDRYRRAEPLTEPPSPDASTPVGEDSLGDLL